MSVLIIYESTYGSTRAIAGNIARGVRSEIVDVLVRSVKAVETADVIRADLLVVGGPTQANPVPRDKSSRDDADLLTLSRGTSSLESDPLGPGLREWFAGLPTLGGAAAAFDTSVDVASLLPCRASKGIARHLRRSGFHLVERPQSFLVTNAGAFLPGQVARAEQWGRVLGRQASRRALDSTHGPGTG